MIPSESQVKERKKEDEGEGEGEGEGGGVEEEEEEIVAGWGFIETLRMKHADEQQELVGKDTHLLQQHRL